MDLISNQFDKNEWKRWERRRSRKIKPISYLSLFLFCFLAYLPILKSDFLWNDYDQVTRSFFPSLNSWTAIFNPTILWNENLLALLSYFLERLLPFDIAFTHHLINIFLHCFASILLLKLLNRMHISGAFLATLLCAVHPVVVQTLFFPGYRSMIIALCLLLLSLYYALDRDRKNSYTIAVILSGATALIHPVALLIPLVLILRSFSKFGTFRLENINTIVPFILIVFVLNICSETAEKNAIGVFGIDPLIDQSGTAGISYQIIEYLRLIYLPFEGAFFIPISEKGNVINAFIVNVLPIVLFSSLYLFCIYFIQRIWGRLLIMGLSLILPLIIFSACQKGLFLDGTAALDENLVYITLIPCVVTVFSTLNAVFAYKIPRLHFLWLCIAWTIILASTALTVKRSMVLSDSFLMWEYFEKQWPESTIPKHAISDYLEANSSENYTLNNRIRMVEFILKDEPDNTEKSILLARLYVEAGQDTNAVKQYKKIVSQVGESEPKIIKEAADYFEVRGLYWDARKTRSLLDKVE